MKLTNLLLLAVSALSPIHCFAAGNWADKWFDNAVYDSPSSFDSQKRGYYTMGGFTARTTTSTDYPITISPSPVGRMGGIDGFWEAFPSSILIFGRESTTSNAGRALCCVRYGTQNHV